MWKKLVIRNISLFIGILVIPLFFPFPVKGADYPNRPIQIIVPWGPGSSSDLIPRILAPHLEKYFKQPFVVVNKVGGGGVVAHAFVAKSKPDAYTLGVVSTFVGTFDLMRDKLDFNMDSFTPICTFARIPLFFLVRADAPWKNLKDFINDAQKNPGKLRYLTFGTFSIPHFAATDFCEKAKINLIHIPYSGWGDSINALLGKQVDLAVTFGSGGHLRGGTLRSLAVAEKERLEDFPDVPTLAETGIPVVIQLVTGFSGPKGIPNEIVNRLYQGCLNVTTAEKPAISDAFRKIEQIMTILGPQEYYKKIREDYEYVHRIHKGLKPM